MTKINKYYTYIFTVIIYISLTSSLLAVVNNTAIDNSKKIELLSEDISKNIDNIINNQTLINKNKITGKENDKTIKDAIKDININKQKIGDSVKKLNGLLENVESNSAEIKLEKDLIEANTVRLYELLIKIHDNEDYLNKVFATLVDIRASLRKLSAKEIETTDNETSNITTKEILLILFAVIILSAAPIAFKKSNIDKGSRSIIPWSIAFLGFTFIGFSLMYGKSMLGLLGSTHYLFINESILPNDLDLLHPIKEYFLFEVGSACLISTIIFNLLKGYRLPFINYILISLFSSILLYSIFGHWVSSGELLKDNMGWLEKLGFIDSAGVIGIYSLAAWFSLVLLWKIKPIKPSGDNHVILSSNSVIAFWLIAIGLSIGSSLNYINWDDISHIIFNLILAASLGAFSLYVYSLIFKSEQLSESIISGGAISAIISVSASGLNITIIEASIIALSSSSLYVLFTRFLIKFILKEPHQEKSAEVISLLSIGSTWGTISFALFSSKGSFGFLDFYQLTLQLQGVMVAFLYAISLAFLLAIIINIINKKYYS